MGGAIRVGRALEEPGFFWFEEPHYHVRAMGEVARALDITVSAGEQTYTLQAVADCRRAPGAAGLHQDGRITWLMPCAALCHALGVELVPHQTQPTIAPLCA